MNKKKKYLSYWEKIRFKYKLSFFNEDTLEEVWSFRLSRLSVYISLSVFIFILVSLTALIIMITPIRNYLPGYLDVEVRKKLMQHELRADSLERLIQIQTLYVDNITDIMTGEVELDSIQEIDSLAQINSDYKIPQGKNESSFVKQFEEDEKYNLSVLNTEPLQNDNVFFYKPVNGLLSSKFDRNIEHYGVDIAAKEGESVLATQEGVVLFTGYDENVGYVIELQHKNGFVSIYKHNQTILKKTGQKVVAGEAIALLGNKGKLSTGPHLHFELWVNGNPVNPEDYIAF